MKLYVYLGLYGALAAKLNSPGLVTLPGERCLGAPYTKHEPNFCDGWDHLTLQECQQKCEENAVAPNCPGYTCQGANFFPATGKCHLFETCDGLEDELAVTAIVPQSAVDSIEDADKAPVTGSGPYAEIASAIPIVLINLTNFTGLVSTKDNHLPMAHQYGNLTADLELLYEKVSGFYKVMHKILKNDGPKYCPFGEEANIRSCVMMSTCIMQKGVPAYVPMESYTLVVELASRFETITWPELKAALFREQGDMDMISDDVAGPAMYTCDGTEAIESYAAAKPVELLEESSSSASAAMSRAAHSTVKLLHSHAVNGSLELTQQRFEELWRPVCEQVGCDHTNYMDIFHASHGQTLKLMQTHSAASVRKEIQERLWLQNKINRFVSGLAQAGEGIHFFRQDDVRKKSSRAMERYTHKGRLSLLAVVQSFEEQQLHEAMQLVDRDRLAAMKEQMQEDESLNKTSDEASRRRRRRRKRCGWLCQLLKCIGRVSVWHAQGYSRMFNPYLSFNFGLAGGGSTGAFQSLVRGQRPHSPSGWMTVNAGLGFGATADWFWGGLSMGAFFSISNHGGHFSITVSASACGWAPQLGWTPACPVGACFGFCPQGCVASPSIAGCFKCMRATGVSISLMCCDVNLIDGSNSCR